MNSATVSTQSLLSRSEERTDSHESLTGSSRWDWMLLGGASLVVWFTGALAALFGFRPSLMVTLGLGGFYLLSYPHLALSFFYVARLPKSFIKRYALPLIVIPVSILVAFVVIYSIWDRGGKTAFEWTYLLFLSLSAYHAAKQTFGVALVSLRYAEIPIDPSFRNVLHYHLMAGVLLDFTALSSFNRFPFMGLTVPGLGWSPSLVYAGYAIFLASAVPVFIHILRMRSSPGGIPALFVVNLLAFYSWLIPCLYYPEFGAYLPNAFHSLQYFAFGFRVASQSSHPRQVTAARKRFFMGWIALAGIAYLLIHTLPRQFPEFSLTSEPSFHYWTAALFLFANLAHYSFDSVIWKFSTQSPIFSLLWKRSGGAR